MNDGRTSPYSLAASRRLVIKIGSALLVEENGAIHRKWLNALADDIAALKAGGTDVVIVSSGAIAAGRRHLGLKPGKLKLEESQAAAATGQIRLAHSYQEALARHDITVAQVLVSPADTEERRRHLNARATILQLLKLGAVPVINENDTVATQEIRYGDNDRLAARVATMISADTMVLLSDIDGLYAEDPNRNRNAAHIPLVEAVTPEIEAMAGDAVSGISTGGMITKLDAARIAMAGGCRMVIALGRAEHALQSIDEGARTTWFAAPEAPIAARKRWIAGTLAARGEVTLDQGAVEALRRGKSLLPAGVTAVGGDFQRGDAVLVKGPDGRTIAKGLSAYGAKDARAIAGKQSGEIASILGYDGRAALIHRDDLALDRMAEGDRIETEEG